jgi:hypothetical protein
MQKAAIGFENIFEKCPTWGLKIVNYCLSIDYR